MASIPTKDQESSSMMPSTTEKPARCGIAKVPREIIDNITENLDPISKLSFALTCKGLLATIDPDKQLQRSRPFQVVFETLNPKCCPDDKDKEAILGTPRWKLLKTLEDERHKCCSGCLKLHPVNEFSAEELAKGPDERKCGEKAGIVSLCPCVAMTFRDKVKLLKGLRKFAMLQGCEGKKAVAAVSENLKTGVFKSWHECKFAYRGAIISLRHTPVYMNGQLGIHSNYIVTTKCPFLDLKRIRRTLCPHNSMHMQFQKIQPEDAQRKKNWTSSCDICKTNISKIHWESDEGSGIVQLSFQTNRLLGRSTENADRAWEVQSYFPFKASSHEEPETCPWNGEWRTVPQRW
ncbi:hypothetical protein FQN50_009013 [Emmonsiellopsis sp. PD_5]|nr:hypothetical protein FQN50_009013 [Emmonsiellopsis sp. PD_5]